MAHDKKKQLSYSFHIFLETLSKQIMRWVDSFEIKISQLQVSQKVYAINACSMREFVENHLIKCNQPSAYLYFIIMDRWTQKRIQNPLQHMKYFAKVFSGL